MLIQAPEVALKLLERYRLSGLPDSILAPEIVPVVLVDDLTRESSADRLECSGWCDTVAAAATYGWIGVATNQSSAWLHRVELYCATSDCTVSVRPSGSAPADSFSGYTVVGTKGYLDRNLPGVPELHLGHKAPAGVAVGVTQQQVFLKAGVVLTLPLGIYLPSFPKSRRLNAGVLQFVAGTPNVTLSANVYWAQYP